MCAQGTNLAFAGDEGAIALESPMIQDLSLEGTLVHSWVEVGKVAAQLVHLKNLNLSNNRLQPLPAAGWGGAALGTLRTLVANDMVDEGAGDDLQPLVAVQQLCAAGALPALAELHLCANAMHQLHLSSLAGMEKLQLLDLSDNQLESWELLEPLATLSHLHTLLLSGNRFDTVPMQPCPEGGGDAPAVADAEEGAGAGAAAGGGGR